MPFRTRPDQPRDLITLLDREVGERIEDAVDYVALDVMVQSRRRRGQPAPVAESARDREEFTAGVRDFLERLREDLLRDSTPDARGKAQEAAARAGDDPLNRLLAVQIALAKELPDYWQRFDAFRLAYTTERLASGGDGRGLLRRLFAR